MLIGPYSHSESATTFQNCSLILRFRLLAWNGIIFFKKNDLLHQCMSQDFMVCYLLLSKTPHVSRRNDYRLGGLNNGNVLPHSSQDWKLELQGKVGLSLPCILRFRWPLKPAGVDQNRGNLCLHLHTPSSLCTFVCLFPSLIRTHALDLGFTFILS